MKWGQIIGSRMRTDKEFKETIELVRILFRMFSKLRNILYFISFDFSHEIYNLKILYGASKICLYISNLS